MARSEAVTVSLYGARSWRQAEGALQDRKRSVLVALDFDGTLVPVVADPHDFRVGRPVIRRLVRAAALPGVTLAVVSARRRRDLARLLPVPRLRIAAHYGLEGALAPTAGERRRYRTAAGRIARWLAPVAAAYPGAVVESKGMTVSIHDRRVTSTAPLRALRHEVAKVARAAKKLGFQAVQGSRVTEFVPRGYDKGEALAALRDRIAASTVFYFGDSKADEPAFARLGEQDFGVHVGAGSTKARYRVRDPEDVSTFLDALISARTGSAR